MFTYNLILILTGILFIILFTSWLKYNPFLSIFIISLTLAIAILPLPEVIPSILKGFGDTMKSIGLIIILGIILGIIIDITGAAKSIANAVIRITGKKNTEYAIHYTGFITGIPIFCDSGYIVLHGINSTLTKQSGKSMVLMASALATGLFSIHCLIPPHPGATAAAGIMGANIGKLILYGIPIALIAASTGLIVSRVLSRKYTPLPSSQEKSNETQDEKLPSTVHSLLPILIPVLLLTSRSALMLIPGMEENSFSKIIFFVGEPVVALLIGIIIAITLFKKIEVEVLNKLFDSAIEKSGSILAITAAGGIFGTIIKMSGIGETAGTYLAATGLGLFIPFLIAAFLKTAQGSSTIAIMTAASIVAPMLNALQLNHENGILLATLAMGAGSMIVSHTNDSYFWVITKFSGLETRDTLRVFSPATLAMGIAAFLCVFVLSFII